MWRGSLEHLIVSCPQKLKVVDKGAANPLSSPSQRTPLPGLALVGRAYVMSKKKIVNFGIIVTGTLF